MVTINDLITVINTTLATKFPAIDRLSTDIEEGFNRPAFFVDIDNHNKSMLGEVLKDVNLTVRIYYFPSSKQKNRIELLTMIEDLNSIFLTNLMINEDFFIPIDEINATITAEKVLLVNFDVRYVYEVAEDEDLELIENLEMNI
jgi:hypothetical protein